MRAWSLSKPAPDASLVLMDAPLPLLAAGRSLLVRVCACGVCHTDLHIVEGELPAHKLPLIPGHQVAGIVHSAASGVSRYKAGDRVGVPWLYTACGRCVFCLRGAENLCDYARFTGWDVDGGYAEYIVADEDFVVPLPAGFTDVQAAPLLCAGIIGYRSLRQVGLQPGERLGLFGFGASAHIAIQLARHWQCPVSVFTRSPERRALAEALGAEWVGTADAVPPHLLDRAVIFAPAGELVPLALARLRRGGALAINAIHMSPIPEMAYELLYGERSVCSVANATRQDAADFMQLAAQIPIRVETQVFPLAEANRVLRRLKQAEIVGAAVLVV